MTSFIKSLFKSLFSFDLKVMSNSTNQIKKGDRNIQVIGNNNTINSNNANQYKNPSVEISDTSISSKEAFTESDNNSHVKYGQSVLITTPGTCFKTGKSGKATFQNGGYMEQKDKKIKISTKPKI